MFPQPEDLSELKVLHSNAGFYVGRTYHDAEMGDGFPYSRESDYFRTSEAAAKHLEYMIKDD